MECEQLGDVARRLEHAMRAGRHNRDLRVYNYKTGTEEPWSVSVTDQAVACFWPRHNPYVGRAQAIYRDARERGDTPQHARARALRWIEQELG